MDAAREQFAAANCSILVVSQATPEVLTRYVSRMSWNVPIVCDPERAAYRAFGLEQTRWRVFFRPSVIWGYLRAMFHGYRVRTPYGGEDLLQLGGDFILNRRCDILYAYRSADPTDRPPVIDLLAEVHTLASTTPMPGEIPSDPLNVDSSIDSD